MAANADGAVTQALQKRLARVSFQVPFDKAGLDLGFIHFDRIHLVLVAGKRHELPPMQRIWRFSTSRLQLPDGSSGLDID